MWKYRAGCVENKSSRGRSYFRGVCCAWSLTSDVKTIDFSSFPVRHHSLSSLRSRCSITPPQDSILIPASSTAPSLTRCRSPRSDLSRCPRRLSPPVSATSLPVLCAFIAGQHHVILPIKQAHVALELFRFQDVHHHHASENHALVNYNYH